MMFINSIFLPKTLSDQSIPDGKSNNLGGFTHLFSNVFRFVKDRQENADPIKLIPLQKSTIENIQDELLKVSLSADNKIVKENSSISMIVSLFVSQFRPGDTVLQKAEKSIAYTTESQPKYFSLSKDDLVKEIKNLFNSLEDINVSQSGNAEISLIANGIITPLNIANSSVESIEELITLQVNNKKDFKLTVKIGNKTLALDVESTNFQNKQSFNPVEIVTENKQQDTNINNQRLSINENKTAPNEFVSNGTSSFQPQLHRAKPDLDNSEIKEVVENKVDAKINEQIVSNKPSAELKTFQTNSSASGSQKIKTDVNSLEQDKTIEKKLTAVKEIEPDFIDQKVQSANDKSAELKTTELLKTEKKISFKSNPKLYSVLVNNSSSEEKIKLNTLIDKTEVKEIRAEIQNLNKKNSLSANIKPDLKHFNVSSKPVLESQLKAAEKPGKEIYDSVVKPDKQFIETKTNERNLNTSTFETIKKAHRNLFPGEVKNIIKSTLNQNSETTKSTQQEFSFNNSQLKAVYETTNKTELKTETRPVTKSVKNELYKNRSVTKQNSLVKESSAKNVTHVETKTESVKPVEIKNLPNNEFKKEVVKVSDEQKSESNLNFFKTISEKIILQEKEIISIETIKKTSITPAEKISTKPETVRKENIKPILNSGEQQEEVKFEKTIQNADLKVNKEKNQTNAELKNITDPKESSAVKIDFKERRVYSQIPKLEVASEDSFNNESGIQKNSSDPLIKDKAKSIDEPVKIIINKVEQKPKEEKQVWVKVSVERNETENISELKRSNQHQIKITIDTDDVKKDFSSSNYSQDEQKENPKGKPQTSFLESSQITENKTFVQSPNNTNQNEILSSIKPEHKTEQSQFKPEMQSESVKYNSRTAELVEKIKVVSSGEMVREVYKVLEKGEKQSVVLKLVPKELGAIKVMLDTVDNVLTAKVEVENETVGQVIRNNVEQLKQNLLQSGVHVNSINISYSSSQQKQHGFNNQKKKNSEYQRENNTEETDEIIMTKKLGYNTYEYLA